jgi:subfamily B ATP-binding cassette protein MsbA
VFSLMLFILVCLLVLLSWPMTLVALLLGIIAIFLVSIFTKRLSRFGEIAAKTGRELTHAVQENLSAVPLIKAYGKEHYQISRLIDKIEDNVIADNRLTSRIFWVQPITEGLGVITIGLMLVGSILIFPANHQFSLPKLLPFTYILIRIATTLKILNDAKGVIIARWPYLKLVYDLVREDNKPFIPDGHLDFPSLQRNIVFDSVSFSYDKKKTALDHVNFTIPRGKTTAIVGESGSGKSTLVNLLLRFYDPQQGSIRLDGNPLPDFRLDSYRRKIGVVSQETFIFNESVKFNIAFGVNESVSDEHIFEAANNAGAHDFILELPDGYDTVLGDRGVMISGGQRQRIAIARAVLRDPEILILDEATSSLDTVTEREVHDTLLKLSQYRTVIIIAHRPSTVKNADHVIVIKSGRIVESGKTRELIQQKGEYYALMHASKSK